MKEEVKETAIAFAVWISNQQVFDDFWAMSLETQKQAYELFLNEDAAIYNIAIKRIGEERGLVKKDGKILAIAGKENARKWAKENIEGKSMFVIEWAAQLAKP